MFSEREKYIGQTTNVKRRKNTHFNNSSNPLLKEDLDRFDDRYFEFSIIDKTSSKEQANALESENITLYQTLFPTGYNRSLPQADFHTKYHNSIHKHTYKRETMGWLLCEIYLVHRRRLHIKQNQPGIYQPNICKLYSILRGNCKYIIKHHSPKKPYPNYQDALDIHKYLEYYTKQTFTLNDFIALREAFDYPYDPTNLKIRRW